MSQSCHHPLRVASGANQNNSGPSSRNDSANSGGPAATDGSVRVFGSRHFAYLAPVIGSIPLFVMAAAACGEERKAINRLALSTSPEPATMAAENTWGN
jgi:hypothetical protein